MGYLHEHEGIRNIALDRTINMEITDETFTMPKDFFHAKIFFEGILDFFFGAIGIPTGGKKTGFCRKQRSLPVRGDRAAFQDERRMTIGNELHLFREDGRNAIVIRVIPIKAIDLAAPSIEPEIDGADRFAVAQHFSVSSSSAPSI